ncbi:cysteine proteinase [Linderina pennispora]|uniref:Cysteine proteinase n=1 Tax=Linderina pennispora TaxID=61395 RepID=A0A1Y1W043_9FUNG|nr:cysteine proteinase [Linderina pennispora]ORX66887.1 cysteine proteinase [Linderina pennispora]
MLHVFALWQKCTGSITQPSLKIRSIDEAMFEKYVPLHRGMREIAHGVMHWEIDSWYQLPQMTQSKELILANQRYQIMLHPESYRHKGYVSVFLSCFNRDQPQLQHPCAYFSLVISNINDPTINHHLAFECRFNKRTWAYGKEAFISHQNLTGPASRFKEAIMQSGTLRISAYVRVIWDETGILWEDMRNIPMYPIVRCVGLHRHPEYHYIGPMLQAIFHMRILRNAIYMIPTTAHNPKTSVASALQRLFRQLESSQQPVAIDELAIALKRNNITSLSMNTMHDFYSIFRRKLASIMSGSVATGIINKLFQGRIRTTVFYPGTHQTTNYVEDFYDFHVDLNWFHNLTEFFTHYCKLMPLQQSAQVPQFAGFAGNAQQRMTFEKLPPVLQIYLNRFDVDPGTLRIKKSESAFEYPQAIDLSDYKSSAADHLQWSRYLLYGAFFHLSIPSDPHAFTCYLSPGSPTRWLHFVNGGVTPATHYEVFDYHGAPDPVRIDRDDKRSLFRRSEHVYMLMYVREDLRDFILNGSDVMALHNVY